MKLSEYAKGNNIGYMKAYRQFLRGDIKGYQTKTGSIIVNENSIQLSTASISTPTSYTMEPVQAVFEDKKLALAATKTRTNRSAIIEPLARFANIDNAFVPFTTTSGGGNTSNLSIRDVTILCQKAYFLFSIVRNIIDTMAEFSASKIYLIGGSKKSREFFDAYFRKINLNDFMEKFFIEYYRSGNCFVYPMLGKLKPNDIKNLTQVFGLESIAAEKVEIPVRYIILNPAEIQLQGSVSFTNPTYLKVLTDYELARLKNPRTEEDKEVFDGLDDKTKKQIKNEKSSAVTIELNNKNIYAVFYKKMDYESFGVSLIFPVLDDLEHKLELKKVDRAICRTVQQAVLLVTFGYETKDGQYMYNQTTAEKLQKLFENESVGRVLVSDFTTKLQFAIPEIGDILDPKKYEIVNEDIREGLNNIIFGISNDKFANQHAKIKVFVEKLRAAREAFINNFLLNEIKKVSKELGFKNYPTPKFEEIDLEDNTEHKRLMVRLAEIGFLTPSETFEAIDTKKLPTKEDSLEHQEEYRKQRDDGVYSPLIGNEFTQKQMQDKQLSTQKEISEKTQQNQFKIAQMKPAPTVSGPTGRPSGTKRKQTTKKVGPIGKGSLEEDDIKEQYSLKKIKENLILAEKLEDEVKNQMKKKFKIKGDFNEEQKGLIDPLITLIMLNEKSEDWISKAKNYVAEPLDKNQENVENCLSIGSQHNLDDFLSSILFNSRL